MRRKQAEVDAGLYPDYHLSGDEEESVDKEELDAHADLIQYAKQLQDKQIVNKDYLKNLPQMFQMDQKKPVDYDWAGHVVDTELLLEKANKFLGLESDKPGFDLRGFDLS